MGEDCADPHLDIDAKAGTQAPDSRTSGEP